MSYLDELSQKDKEVVVDFLTYKLEVLDKEISSLKEMRSNYAPSCFPDSTIALEMQKTDIMLDLAELNYWQK